MASADDSSDEISSKARINKFKSVRSDLENLSFVLLRAI